MAFITRRRNFKIFIICCVFLSLTFTWYSKTCNTWTSYDAQNENTNEIPSRTFPIPDSMKEYDSNSDVYSELVTEESSSKAQVSESNKIFAHLSAANVAVNLKLDTEETSSEAQVSESNEKYDPNEGKDMVMAIQIFDGKKYELIMMTSPLQPDTDNYSPHPTSENGEHLHDDEFTMPFKWNSGLEFFAPIEKENKMDVTKGLMPLSFKKNMKRSKTLNQNMHPQVGLESSTLRDSKEPETTKNPGLLLDTPGCKVPKFDPWDPTVRHLIEIQKPYQCPGPPLFMKSNPDGSITLNVTVLEKYYNIKSEELQCEYQAIYRSHEYPGTFRELTFRKAQAQSLKFGVPLEEDYIEADCRIGNISFEQYFPLVRLKKEVEEERNAIPPPIPRLNVILVGIDSVSKLNFLRHFNKTRKFLDEKLSPFEMNGYTKVGDNTFPNLVPMLTGHFVEHYWNESLKNDLFFDDLDLIWKRYAKKGFRTFYAEDNPLAGTFNYLKRGFYDPPTDYYFRPLALAMHLSKLMNETRKDHCLNSQIEPDIIFDYLRDFLKAMGERPYFAFAMVSNLTHDVLNKAGWADEPTEHLLDDMLNIGALNNSLLVLFSDHGLRFGEIRYTYIGKIEERMPMMYIYAPKWFLRKYPEIEKNLRINQDRLMTLFDIHATMIHLLDLNMKQEERSTLTWGSSLFEEISPDRTCAEANILPHWCPCQTFENVAISSTEAVKASKTIISDINSQLKPYRGICEILNVDKVLDARVAQTNDLVLKYLRYKYDEFNNTVLAEDKVTPVADYLITLVTKPGGAVFEGTVRHEPKNNTYTALGISRINMYGSTSWCIDSQKLKIFCYCKIQKPI